ncbi:hypothetical protein [Erwinia sp. INIA01]|uniref:hypothetical protein n=1 Tax=Erwinia sp. INIA01 TaxID=2991500 RepID=UPI00403854E0
MTLDAARDINLLSAQNTERTEGKNLSHDARLRPENQSERHRRIHPQHLRHRLPAVAVAVRYVAGEIE